MNRSILLACILLSLAACTPHHAPVHRADTGPGVIRESDGKTVKPEPYRHPEARMGISDMPRTTSPATVNEDYGPGQPCSVGRLNKSWC